MDNHENGIKAYLKSPQSLILFIKNSSDHWLIKDHEARYVFVNESASDFFRFSKRFNAEGKSDKDVQTDICQELWPEFIESDQKAIKENKKIISIAIHHYVKGNM
ncbi:hypothetical protein SGGMMB4_00106 [Sodalis glossinidius str. 'morsitans']|uniref:PAS fold-4 domain-containing protein n=1 Tax=Sodalis glossinidius (strain morsitans) TaxID=343509 RepID=Q2NWY5_SODGM|nr:PAS domain-containing protein [Sodalis glossinidius]BAE73340.1 hypothetical protein SG0065 [Sodalis glossinidius str. 'morsitans']CRL43659.1 hypothetical protein SGGMMB4_00106 [Sodalis glossinidius str. 'morsitans']